MNLSQLYYFRKLAELQHYTKAAKELFITQPTLSGSISSLEQELGVSLFQKAGRNVELTKYGAEFLKYVNASLEQLDKGIAIMKGYSGEGDGGVIDLGCIITLQTEFLPRLLNGYSSVNERKPNSTSTRSLLKNCFAELSRESMMLLFAHLTLCIAISCIRFPLLSSTLLLP